MTIPLSAVIITVNQEKKIEKTIEALKTITDDIVVVDSGSIDLTRKVARRGRGHSNRTPLGRLFSTKKLWECVGKARLGIIGG